MKISIWSIILFLLLNSAATAQTTKELDQKYGPILTQLPIGQFKLIPSSDKENPFPVMVAKKIADSKYELYLNYIPLIELKFCDNLALDTKDLLYLRCDGKAYSLRISNYSESDDELLDKFRTPNLEDALRETKFSKVSASQGYTLYERDFTGASTPKILIAVKDNTIHGVYARHKIMDRDYLVDQASLASKWVGSYNDRYGDAKLLFDSGTFKIGISLDKGVPSVMGYSKSGEAALKPMATGEYKDFQPTNIKLTPESDKLSRVAAALYYFFAYANNLEADVENHRLSVTPSPISTILVTFESKVFHFKTYTFRTLIEASIANDRISTSDWRGNITAKDDDQSISFSLLHLLALANYNQNISYEQSQVIIPALDLDHLINKLNLNNPAIFQWLLSKYPK